MKQRVVVHIGGSKCGSSAIQRFLLNNHKGLAERQFIVPTQNLMKTSERTGEQIWYFQNMIGDGDDTHGPRFRARVAEIMDNQESDATLVLSAENLSNPHGFEALFKGLEDRFDVQIVLYIRRQDDYLMSAWQQWFLKTNPDFWTWCTTQVGIRANWQLSVEPWVDTFGKDAISVRVFEREQLEGQDINKDFCKVIGCNATGLDFKIGNINPSYNMAVQELAESAQSLFAGLHDNAVYEMIGSLTGNRHYKRSDEVFLNRNEREAIVARYAESNAWIKEIFLPDLDRETLFAPIRTRSFQHPTRTIEQEKEAVLLDLIFQLYRKIK